MMQFSVCMSWASRPNANKRPNLQSRHRRDRQRVRLRRERAEELHVADPITKQSCQTACFWTAVVVASLLMFLEWRQSDAWLAHSREQAEARATLQREYDRLVDETRRLRVELEVQGEAYRRLTHCENSSSRAP